MKTLYHGTVDKFVPEIVKHGLKPVIGNTWDASKINGDNIGYNPKVDDEKGYVYLTPKGDRAADYATSKARYLRAQPGEVFVLDGMGGMKMRKMLNAPYIPDANATVLELELPDDVKLEHDEHDFTGAYKHKGAIVPLAVKPLSITEARHAVTESLVYDSDPFEAILRQLLKAHGMPR